MEEHVTIIPGDGIISVNGLPMQFKFPPVAGYEKVHAIQWHEGSGTLELDGFTGEPLRRQTMTAPSPLMYSSGRRKKRNGRLKKPSRKPNTTELKT